MNNYDPVHAILLKEPLFRLRLKIIIFKISYIIFASLCPAFLKRVDMYKAHHCEMCSVLQLASYTVLCNWSNTLSESRKCDTSYHIWKISSQQELIWSLLTYQLEPKSDLVNANDQADQSTLPAWLDQNITDW